MPKEKDVERSPPDGDRSSDVSSGSRNSIIVRADLLRKQAEAEEQKRSDFWEKEKRARAERRWTDALSFQVEKDEAQERAASLHKQASRRYFKGIVTLSPSHVYMLISTSSAQFVVRASDNRCPPAQSRRSHQVDGGGDS